MDGGRAGAGSRAGRGLNLHQRLARRRIGRAQLAEGHRAGHREAQRFQPVDDLVVGVEAQAIRLRSRHEGQVQVGAKLRWPLRVQKVGVDIGDQPGHLRALGRKHHHRTDFRAHLGWPAARVGAAQRGPAKGRGRVQEQRRKGRAQAGLAVGIPGPLAQRVTHDLILGRNQHQAVVATMVQHDHRCRVRRGLRWPQGGSAAGQEHHQQRHEGQDMQFHE